MFKRIMLPVLFFLCLVTSGCFLAAFMSDPLYYGFKGTIRRSSDNGAIAGVVITASCKNGELFPPPRTFSGAVAEKEAVVSFKKGRPYPPLQTVSNEQGLFSMYGRILGFDEGCEVTLSHPQFKTKVIKLLRRDSSPEGFAYVWNLDVELERNTSPLPAHEKTGQ